MSNSLSLPHLPHSHPAGLPLRNGQLHTPVATRRASWSSVEELQTLAKGLSLDLLPLQLQGGAFGGQVLSADLPPLRLARFQVNGALHNVGQRPKGMLAICMDLDPRPGRAPGRAHGQQLPMHCLFGLGVDREIHLTLPGHITLGVVFLPFEALGQWATELGWPGFAGELLPQSNLKMLHPSSAKALRHHLREVFAMAERSPAQLLLPATQRLVLDDLIPLLLEALIHDPAQELHRLRPPARIEVVKEVQAWIHDHPTQPITLADLCRQAHTSRRTLIQGFHDHLGMGPMAYLKLIRLHGIRKRLLQAEPSSLQIGATAAEWGFFNAGHFAADYRRLFGERPRETLQRAA